MRRLRHLTGQHRTPSTHRLRSAYALPLLLPVFGLPVLSQRPLYADSCRTLRRKAKAKTVQQSS